MAVVHWQQPDPPEPEQLRRYLQDTWSLNPDELEIEALGIPWFREASGPDFLQNTCTTVFGSRN